MKSWQSGNVVCIHKVEWEGEWPAPQDYHRATVELMQAMDVRPDREKVVLKPNVVVPYEPEVAVTTNPHFLGGIIDYLIDAGVPIASMVVADGGGGDDDHDMLGKFFPVSGITSAAQERGVRLLDLNEDPPVWADVPQGQVFKRVPIASTIHDPEAYIINIPRMKTHNLGITTLSIKNWQGTVTPITQRHFCTLFPRYEGDTGEGLQNLGLVADSHERWARKITDVHMVRQPDLNVLEGLVGREGTGFRRGKNIPMGLAIAGVNTVAVDTVTSYLMGFNPYHIGYLNIAAERGLGTNDLSQIDVLRVDAGELVRLEDLESLRADPPFNVILAEQFKYTSMEGLIYSSIEREHGWDDMLAPAPEDS